MESLRFCVISLEIHPDWVSGRASVEIAGSEPHLRSFADLLTVLHKAAFPLPGVWQSGLQLLYGTPAASRGFQWHWGVGVLSADLHRHAWTETVVPFSALEFAANRRFAGCLFGTDFGLPDHASPLQMLALDERRELFGCVVDGIGAQG